MPSRTSIQHVEDDKLMHEQKVTLNLLVEGIGEIHAARVAGARFGPLPAYWASTDNFWYEIENLVCNTYTLKKSFHGVL